MDPKDIPSRAPEFHGSKGAHPPWTLRSNSANSPTVRSTSSARRLASARDTSKSLIAEAAWAETVSSCRLLSRASARASSRPCGGSAEM